MQIPHRASQTAPLQTQLQAVNKDCKPSSIFQHCRVFPPAYSSLHNGIQPSVNQRQGGILTKMSMSLKTRQGGVSLLNDQQTLENKKDHSLSGCGLLELVGPHSQNLYSKSLSRTLGLVTYFPETQSLLSSGFYNDTDAIIWLHVIP